MLKINTLYRFKTTFAKELGIPANQVDRRRADLLIWLKNFFDYTFYADSNPQCIIIKEIYGEYQPMPRKLPDQSALTQQKKEDYTNFTIASLGTEFKPNSQRKIARDAIDNFGYDKYSHINARSVAERYIKEPFQKYGESDHKKIWVWYSTYEPIPSNLLEEWRQILRDEHIAEEEAANAFYRQEQGEDISAEKGYYKTAQQKFKEKYNDIAVLVTSWKLKELKDELEGA